VCAAVVATAACAAAAPAASGATLSNAGGTLTYAGTDANNDVSFVETGANEVTVDRQVGPDNDPIVEPTPGCTRITAGETYRCGGVTRVVASGAVGGDELDAGGLANIPATLDGGLGSDGLEGGGAADALTSGPGPDAIDGGAGNDTIDGGADSDQANGEAGDDTVNGGTGDDFLFGGVGNDTLRGNGGNDQAFSDAGNDDIGGGDGYDLVSSIASATPPADLLVSLDDVADDRTSEAGESDSVRADVEAVQTGVRPESPFGPPSGNDTLRGNAGPNSLTSGSGNDTIDGGGGNDVLSGGDGDDTIRARDGFADFISCGEGNDTAEVDTLDTVSECETVNRADVGNANDVPEDASPAITLDGPASGALLRTFAPTVITATATDDRGIVQVLFIDDERVVCADTVAPYSCDYRPRGEDVGRNTLVAIAVDTAQQTASSVRAFNVGRFAVAGITGTVTPSADRRAPFVFRTAGRLRLPAGVTPALGCADGQVSIQVKAGPKTISTRRADLRGDCTFSSTARFADRKRFTRSGRLRFTLRFTGNEVLDRSAAIARNIRTR
jgi:Ca2+-binding RTX toxin-like protein